MRNWWRCYLSVQIYVWSLFLPSMIAALMLPLSLKCLYLYHARRDRDFTLHGVGFGKQEHDENNPEFLLQIIRGKVYRLHAAVVHG
jgi:hypothetical protein